MLVARRLGADHCGSGPPLFLAGRTPLRCAAVALAPNLPIGLIDGLEQLAKAGGLFDGPKPIKGRAKQLHIALGKQAHGYDTVITHEQLPIASLMRNVCKDTAVPSVSRPESMQGVRGPNDKSRR